MDFYKALDTDSSRAVAELVTRAVGDNPEYFKQVLDLTLRDIPKISSRAGRVVFLCCEKYPDLILPYLNDFIKNLSKIDNEGTLRTILKVITIYKNIEDEHILGILVDQCFKFLSDNVSAVAIKVYSMDILFNILQKEPDLKSEFISIVEDQIPKNSTAFKARGKMVLKKLRG